MVFRSQVSEKGNICTMDTVTKTLVTIKLISKEKVLSLKIHCVPHILSIYS